MSNQTVDVIVETANPAALDRVIQAFGAAVVQSDTSKAAYLKKDGGYVVRCFGNADFIKFAIEHEGYGHVKKTLDKLV